MLKKVFRKIWRLFKSFIVGIFWYTRDYFNYQRMLKSSVQSGILKVFPKFFDKDPQSHTFDKHYVYMDAWALKKLIVSKPVEHIDVGSSIRFLSMASAVTLVNFIDIRPIKLDLENFRCTEGSIIDLPFANNSVDSISCLHVAEHIGLGRYGDPLDPLGTEKACKELTRILAPGGKLYFALPVGKNATYFNAHRVHSPNQILNYLFDLKLISFSAVKDDGHFYQNIKPDECQNESYACGMFLFTK